MYLTWQICSQRNLVPFSDRVESEANPVDKLSRGVSKGPWREVVHANFPTVELQELAETCGGWMASISSA